MISESVWDKMRGGRTVAVRSTSGLITQEEFDTKKKDLLDKM
jgi:hypothetical protein